MAIGTKRVSGKPLNFGERLFVPEIAKGMAVVLSHFARNFVREKDVVTLSYPEEKAPYPERFRGAHRLMRRDDGSVRCVACMCCSTACPARCIHIVAEEAPDPRIEKRPAVFKIDELRCVYCGLCVEACPCDAIRMDSGIHVHPVTDRREAYWDKEHLMSLGGPSIAVQGGRARHLPPNESGH
ncbi:MAG TPA: NADH-quinone oxidoreductase subunit I [Myxococcota bacterium]|nr:NADH-quinone oxidoreductase subunit I [Myxococcota bacterium]